MDELDREEFYRLKKVQGKKKRDAAVAEAEVKKRAAAIGDTDATTTIKGEESATTEDLLDPHDEDVIF